MKFKGYEGSKDRALALNYPGSKSILDALELAKKKNNPLPDDTPVDIPEITPYESMREAIHEIECSLNCFDIDQLDPTIRKRLAEMKLDDVESIRLWKNAWIRVSGEIKCGGSTGISGAPEETRS